MNKDQFAGKWKEMRGKVKEMWGKLSNNDLAEINGKWDQLSGRLQQKYGWTMEQAEKEIQKLCTACEHPGTSHTTAPSGKGQKNTFKNRDAGHEAKPHQADTTSQQGQAETKPADKHEHKDKKRKAS